VLHLATLVTWFNLLFRGTAKNTTDNQEDLQFCLKLMDNDGGVAARTQAIILATGLVIVAGKT